MAKPWDDSMRTLVRIDPQAFVTWLIPGACFVRELPEKLRNWQLEVDVLIEVLVHRKKMLLHIEFQTYGDKKMPERLLRYNVLARSEYGHPVISVVIYLLKKGRKKRGRSPLTWKTPLGLDVLLFHFVSLEIEDFTPEEILQMEQPGLLPFLPLTKNGATREVVQQMFAAIDPQKHQDLAQVAFSLASLVFIQKRPLDWQWLKGRFPEMFDLFRETPMYTEALQEGRQEGRQEGLQEGLRQGLDAQRDVILSIVRTHFPELEALAKQRVVLSSNLKRLTQIALQLVASRDEQDALRVLLTITEDA